MLLGRYGRPIPSTSPKVGFPLLVSGFFYGRIPKVKSFTESMMGIANGNFIYSLNLTIVVSVSSTLPKDGLSPPRSFRWAFFLTFCGCQRKNPRSIPMRVSLSSLVPSSRSGFCERIMNGNACSVYMHCSIVQQTRKNPLGYSQRAEIQPKEGGGDKLILLRCAIKDSQRKALFHVGFRCR
jgi:hypothetical protein